MNDLEREIELLKEYLLMCFNNSDFHGVMDAAADIRERLAVLKQRG